MMDDVNSDILGERGLRYKRNVLVICLVATLVWWIGIDLGDVRVFGVSLKGVQDQERAAWFILLLLLVHQWGTFMYYALTDFRSWQGFIREHFKLYPRSIVGKLKVGDDAYDPQYSQILELDENRDADIIEIITSDQEGSLYKRTIRISERNTARIRFSAFASFEFGFPCIWGFVAILIAFDKVFYFTTLVPAKVGW